MDHHHILNFNSGTGDKIVKVRMFDRKKSKVGLAPGTLVHVGEKKAERVVVSVWAYNQSELIEKEMETVEDCLFFKDRPDLNVWINVDGLDRVEVIEKLGNCFGIHPLTLEDILNTGQRPKMEDYGSYIHTVLKMMLLSKNGDENLEEIIVDQISIILGPNFLIS